MSALYREYRPKTFSEVIGQDHVVTALTNALKRDQINHAFLFAGPRGTGKTSVARLLSKSVNCLDRQGAEPCNKCAVCKEFNAGEAVDVIEIDAASNRGIDEIRELRERIRYAPGRAKYRIYIIDEVHMLTKEAFNALLKTLEEPPSHAIFILATTELHKLPETIISRCQRYHFHRASETAIIQVLKDVIKKEKLKLSDEAVTLLAQRAEGSFRDALTLLGNLKTHEGEITPQVIRELFGLPQAEVVNNLLKSIETGDTSEILKICVEAIAQGEDLTVLIKSVVEELEREIFSLPATERLKSRAVVLEQLLLALARSRHSSDPSAVLVSAVVRIAGNNSTTVTVTVPVAPVAPPPIAPMNDLQMPVKPDKEEPTPVDSLQQPPAPPGEVSNFWEQFLQEVKSHNHALYMVVRSAQLGEVSEDKLIIVVKFRFYADRLNEVKNRKVIESSAVKLLNRPVILECQVKSDLDIQTKVTDDVMDSVVEVFELDGS